MQAVERRLGSSAMAARLTPWLAPLTEGWRPLVARPVALTVLAALGAAAGLAVAALLSHDPREAGTYAVACLMIGGAVALGRRGGAPEGHATADTAPAIDLDLGHEAARLEMRSVAHDLRAPLLTVSSYLDLIADGAFGAVPAEARAALLRASAVAGRAQTVVETTLQGARLDGPGGGTSTLARVDLQAVMLDVLGALTASMRERRASVALEGRLPAVRGDETALFRIFENLLQNSLKYGRPGVPPSISIHSRRLTGGDVEVTVRDNGAGISAGDAPALMLAGVRGGTAGPDLDGDTRGHGLGLATVARLVTRLGGTVTFDAPRGGAAADAAGAVVRVTLRAG